MSFSRELTTLAFGLVLALLATACGSDAEPIADAEDERTAERPDDRNVVVSEDTVEATGRAPYLP